MMPSGSSFGGLDLQGSIRVSHHQHPHSLQQQHHSHPRLGLMTHPSIHEVFPLSMGQNHEYDQSNSMTNYNTMEGKKNSPNVEGEHSFNEEGVDNGHNDSNKEKKVSTWQRVKWTDSMVKLLITAVSYIGEDGSSEGGSGSGGRRKYLNLQKKGKWKSISKVMAERGFYVSPQQCEDKFNDLNKRYKKLNDILGRGTSCQVVEKPALLDMMDHVSEKMKDEVRKILSSKQLFYEEMCSYHNGNRLHLPHDPALQKSLQLALRSRDDEDSDARRHVLDDDHDADIDDHEEYEENHCQGRFGVPGDSLKRMKQEQSIEDFSFGKSQCAPDMHVALPEGEKAAWTRKQWYKSRTLQLEEQKLQIQLERVELEKQHLKWQRFSKKKDRELEKLKIENDRMMLENERMALELKQMEINLNCHQVAI